MPPILTVCAECERHAHHRPRQARAMAEALAGLTGLLQERWWLQDLQVVRAGCLQDCPAGKVCVLLNRRGREARHHLSPRDDLRLTAARLAAAVRWVGPGPG